MKGGMAQPGSGLASYHNTTTENMLIPSIDRNLTKRFSAEVQQRYAEVWKNLNPQATISRPRTIEEALQRARKIGDQEDGMQTLVTGSLHLVSGVLCLLEPDHPTERLY
jgi:folylpolyglutamate synthase